MTDVRTGDGVMPRWDLVPVQEDPPSADDWVVVPENGLGALVCWCVGPRHCVRIVVQLSDAQLTTLVRITADGQSMTTRHPRTPDDQAEIDDDIDAFLANAKVPGRPRSCRWFVRRPAGVRDDEEFWRRIEEQLSTGPERPRPEDWHALLEARLPVWYAEPEPLT